MTNNNSLELLETNTENKQFTKKNAKINNLWIDDETNLEQLQKKVNENQVQQQ